MYSIGHCLFLQIICFGFSFAANHRLAETSFILNFMKSQSGPKAILENLCWSKDQKLELQRKLKDYNLSYRSLSNDKNFFEHFYHPHFYTVFADVECDFEDFLKDALKTTLVKYPNIWIVFGEYEELKRLSYYIPISSWFLIPIKDKHGNYMEIKSLYKINKRDTEYVEMPIASWSISNQAYDLKNINLVRDRINFRRMPLRVTYVVTDNGTLEHFTDYRDKHLDNLTKINYVLYDFICDLLNASQVRLITDDWGFESKINGSTFSEGMFQDLVYDRSDVAGTVSFTPASRLKYFKYIFAPIKDFSVHFVLRAPSLAYYTNIFALPFDNMVWITIGLLLIFCSVIVKIIFNWEAQEKAFAQLFENNEERPSNIFDIIMMQIAIMCQMDYVSEPKSISGKIAVFSVLISFTFIYTAFSARIVLLLQSNTNKIKDLDSLYAANFDFGVENSLYNIFYFRAPSDRSDEYWRKLIYENQIKQPGGDRFLGAAEGMKLVRDSYFTLHIEQSVGDYLIERSFSNVQKCSLQYVETIYKADIPYLATSRYSPYVEFFVVSFRRLAETGVHNREYRRCFTKKPSCEGRGNIFVSVGLIESYFPFLVFGSGIFLSIAVLVMENLVYARFKMRCVL